MKLFSLFILSAFLFLNCSDDVFDHEDSNLSNTESEIESRSMDPDILVNYGAQGGFTSYAAAYNFYQGNRRLKIKSPVSSCMNVVRRSIETHPRYSNRYYVVYSNFTPPTGGHDCNTPPYCRTQIENNKEELSRRGYYQIYKNVNQCTCGQGGSGDRRYAIYPYSGYQSQVTITTPANSNTSFLPCI